LATFAPKPVCGPEQVGLNGEWLFVDQGLLSCLPTHWFSVSSFFEHNTLFHC